MKHVLRKNARRSPHTGGRAAASKNWVARASHALCAVFNVLPCTAMPWPMPCTRYWTEHRASKTHSNPTCYNPAQCACEGKILRQRNDTRTLRASVHS